MLSVFKKSLVTFLSKKLLSRQKRFHIAFLQLRKQNNSKVHVITLRIFGIKLLSTSEVVA